MNRQVEANSQLGHFLDFQTWYAALKLIEYQLGMKPDNKHFNTLSMFYYERLSSTDKAQLEDEAYFKTRVANNLFYGLAREFAIYDYPIPKSNLGLRKYRFFTYPMRVVYYAVGVYLLRLSQEFLSEYYNLHKHIHSDYGGKLAYNEQSNQLQLNYDAVWYKPHYKRFRNRVRREVREDTDKKVVIHIDIQNYFEEISIPCLLDFLSRYMKPAIQREFCYDTITMTQLISFFDFMANGRPGIPQSDNDIISSFIGHLYLVFGDLLIDQEINRANTLTEQHCVIRYMDDMYISLTFDDNAIHKDKETYVSGLASRIADILYQELGLRLNTKTKLYWLSNDADLEDLLRHLKRVSPGHEIADDDTATDPNEKVDSIFRQLEKLNSTPLDPTFNARKDLDEEILKEVYNKSVYELLKKDENRDKIRSIFAGFDFHRIIAQPKEILVVMLLDQAALEELERFLVQKEALTSREVYLVLNYLCQTDFRSQDLLELLKRNLVMKPIMEVFCGSGISSHLPGYFDLAFCQLSDIVGWPHVIDQIRFRVQFERRGEFSIALNHLLNEVHAICFRLDGRTVDESKYKAQNVVNFLISKRVPHETCVQIRNLFDRRNKSPVSHADPIAWPIGKDEYTAYRNHVGICLSQLL